ncbi:MAG: Ig-like domain-containing protein, partial [Sporomusa sp.]
MIKFNNLAGNMQPFAGSPVNIIDSIVITEELDTSRILAEWIAYDPSIAVYSDLRATQAVKLFINWSDRNGTVNLHQGDYFTFVVPNIFLYDYVENVTDVPITNEAGEIVATYSIYDNINNMKEVKITFTDYVENHTNISGNFWMLLFVGSVASTEQKSLQFVINDNLVAQGVVTVNPNTGYTPRNHKVGFSLPTRSAGGYYIFEWIVYFNMGENAVNGFNTLEGFSFEDIIPADSPHVFLTDEIRQELGILPTDYVAEIGEYTGADAVPPGIRYQVFLNQYNSTGANSWYNFIQWHTMASGLTTIGINGNGGLNVSNIEVADKLFSASLGTITRPTSIRFFTISTIKISESALGDPEVVKLFKNIFKGSYGENLTSSLTLYRFEAGGSAQGITGDYGFTFIKVNGKGDVLSGALFSLFTSENFAAGADRFLFSGEDGVVTFNHLPTGTYYVLETAPPYGYLPNSTIYKVVLGREGFEIYYGENFQYMLRDLGNRIVNQSEYEIQPAVVILTGKKNLAGHALENGMFSFIVKDSEGNTTVTGTNNADGSIQFSS